MSQAPFHISSLTSVLFGLSALLDTGECDDISVQDVKQHALRGDLIAFLYEQGDFDTGVTKSNREFADWYSAKIRDLCDVVDERRKYGIENRGVCLLISYTAELIQQGQDIRMEHTGH
jgi:hypothetical protein